MRNPFKISLALLCGVFFLGGNLNIMATTAAPLREKYIPEIIQVGNVNEKNFCFVKNCKSEFICDVPNKNDLEWDKNGDILLKMTIDQYGAENYDSIYEHFRGRKTLNQVKKRIEFITKSSLRKKPWNRNDVIFMIKIFNDFMDREDIYDVVAGFFEDRKKEDVYEKLSELLTSINIY